MTGGWVPSDRHYMVDDLCRSFTRVAANEGWFCQEWLGLEVWQLAEDLIRLQAVIQAVRPRWIIETGTKFGGLTIFLASILQLIGRDDGGVMTVDLTPTEAAATAFATHPLADWVRLSLTGDAADPAVIGQFAGIIDAAPGPVLVFLDDNHNADHVARELVGYGNLVTRGSYMIVGDTVFADLAGTPVGAASEKYPDVTRSNPRLAVERFLVVDDRYVRMPPPIPHGPGNFLDGFLCRRNGK